MMIETRDKKSNPKRQHTCSFSACKCDTCWWDRLSIRLTSVAFCAVQQHPSSQLQGSRGMEKHLDLTAEARRWSKKRKAKRERERQREDKGKGKEQRDKEDRENKKVKDKDTRKYTHTEKKRQYISLPSNRHRQHRQRDKNVHTEKTRHHTEQEQEDSTERQDETITPGGKERNHATLVFSV